ncbi:MAG TPA: Gfo/Idh/MocA family oxidoreductase [Clostridia bacterium]|nr:Gfo/Idh/MocA family oxidoreductase [Clostridia bacterium]
MTNLKIGIVGLGARGTGLLKLIARMKDVDINYLCDLYADRVENAQNIVKKVKGYAPSGTNNYKDIIEDKNIDAILILSSWESHTKIALEAMANNIYVGLEVGGAYDIQECWDLVDAYEKYKTPCMMLENCCYGKYELMVLNMVKKGLFGTVVHCSGGYQHDLRKEIAFGKENRHYRLQNYLTRNCENYPTHELGPIAKILNINRGNKMNSLVSISSKAKGMSDYIKQYKSDDEELINAEFAQGDIVTTVIKCENGETIVLTLDTTLPRHYSRGFTVRGTLAMYQEEANILFLDKKHQIYDFYSRPLWNNGKRYARKYAHPIWKQYKKEGIKRGHGGMDYLVLRAFFESVHAKTDTPIDVYDTASWMCITALSEKSIKEEKVVEIPDFTKGKWKNREKSPQGKYTID